MSDEQTNLISKINLLLAVCFLLYLPLKRQQLHGFDNCLENDKYVISL